MVTRHQSVLAKLFGVDWSLRDYREPASDYMCLGQKVVFKGAGGLLFYLCRMVTDAWLEHSPAWSSSRVASSRS